MSCRDKLLSLSFVKDDPKMSITFLLRQMIATVHIDVFFSLVHLRHDTKFTT
jgi:hypothetical protein